MRIQKILFPTDLSPEGERAVPAAVDLVRQLRATAVILHVVENVGASPVGAAAKQARMLPGTKEELERVRGLLEKRKGTLPDDVKVELDVVVAPSVPHAIADYARSKGCDLIALSTHGRQGFRRMIMGSVAEAVLRQSGVPVLVFPRQE